MVSERQHYNQITGDLGENAVFEALRDLGYSPEWGMEADLSLGGVDIEVKTSHITAYRADGRPGYQFCLRRDGHCDIRASIVVLVCIGDETNEYFVIPAEKVGKRRKIAIPRVDVREYRGQWSDYLGRWDLLDTSQGGLGEL